MAKVTKNAKAQMQDYIVSRLEESGICIARILGQDSLLMEDPSFGRVVLYLHTDTEGAKKFQTEQVQRRNAGQNLANIFYKDEQTFFVPLTEDEIRAFGRTTNSRYSGDQMYQMIKLRQKEADVLDSMGNKTLSYYQPETVSAGGKLEEGLVNFKLIPTIVNYDHIDPNTTGYYAIAPQSDNPLKRRVLSSDKRVLRGDLALSPSRPDSRVLGFNAKLKLPRGFPDQVAEDQVHEFLTQNGTDSLEDWGGIEGLLSYLNPQ